MNSRFSTIAAGSLSPISRRTVLRSLAAAPIAALVASSSRVFSHGTLAATSLQTGTPAACAATPQASPEASPTPAVEIKMTDELRFDPDPVVIKSGQTITWNNASAMPHSATGDHAQNPVDKTHPDYVELPDGAEPWGSEILQPGETYSHTFTTPGKYAYICIPHVLSGMRGTITVECA